MGIKGADEDGGKPLTKIEFELIMTKQKLEA